mmetsp:Transcript_20684/g.39328  ORF Transcript_20684/g.39328 Transcript_20684/m.39328 type:complete len:334 (-) Transcript_20684:373-1374(-)
MERTEEKGNKMAMAKKQTKVKKYKKAPLAPKRFKSAFMYFSEQHHKTIREGMGSKKIRAAVAAKMVSQAWKELSDEQRAKFQEMARIDRERYEREKAAYKGPWRVPDIKHPNPPKKPMSAFLAFGNERRKAIGDANPSLTNAEISSLLSKLWKQCPVDVKQAYRDREAREREIFKKYRAEWELEKDMSLLEASANEDCELSTATASSLVQSDDETTEMDTKIPSSTSQVTSKEASRHVTNHHSPVDYENPLVNVKSHTPSFFRPPTMPNATPQVINLPRRETLETATRFNFEDYSIDELLQDEELFEDFSPDAVPRVPSRPGSDHVDGSFTSL